MKAVIPKPLLPIGEKVILEIPIERLRKFGVTEVQHVRTAWQQTADI